MATHSIHMFMQKNKVRIDYPSSHILCQNIPAVFIISRLSREKQWWAAALSFLPKPAINQMEDSQLAWHPPLSAGS